LETDASSKGLLTLVVWLLGVCSVQRPSGSHPGANTSGGYREFIPTIARMAAAVGVDGFFMETHPDPNQALCDAATMLPLDELEPLLLELIDISRASKARN